MSRETHYFYDPDTNGLEGELPTDEATHAVRALRLDDGDELYIMNGRGNIYHAHITTHTRSRCLYAVDESSNIDRSWHGSITLAIAPTKNIDRIEWMVEKATEIGIDRIVFIRTAFAERTSLRIDRIQRIIVSAMKQSRQAWMPQCDGLISFSDFLTSLKIDASTNSRRYIAHCYDEQHRRSLVNELANSADDDNFIVMVGPEGDFSIDEVKQALDERFIPVTLGSSRLRTETAGLYAVNAFHVVRDLGNN